MEKWTEFEDRILINEMRKAPEIGVKQAIKNASGILVTRTPYACQTRWYEHLIDDAEMIYQEEQKVSLYNKYKKILWQDFQNEHPVLAFIVRLFA